jgi:LysM repeat protein
VFGVLFSFSNYVNAQDTADTALSPDVSFLSISQNKDTIDPNTSVNTLDNALLPVTSHISVPGETEAGSSYSDQISVYVVRKGDSISQIAEMFGVSVQTILAANDMKKTDKLVEGNVLFILPISGIEHTITKGQTLQTIAKLYKVDVSDITQFNGITEDAVLAIGDKIMIPGGEMMDEGGDKPASNLGSSIAIDKNYYITHPIQNLTGYFINPVPTGHKTQGLHGPGYRGIDIGAPKGTPIYASAAGTVYFARTGWNGGYGNLVIVNHPNGTRTLYAHMTKLGTYTGKSVAQGEVIGYVGSTGHSTGPHIHFEVFSAKNPGSDWSWAN